MKKILILTITMLLFIFGGMYIFKNYIKKHDIIINNEIVYSTTEPKLNDSVNKYMLEYQETLIETARKKVIRIEDVDESELSEIEEVEIIQHQDNEIEIRIIHKVARQFNETIPFDSEIKEDSNQYTNYKQITTEGIDGVEITAFTNVYVNGEWIDATDIDTQITMPVTEIITVGTKEIQQSPRNGDKLAGGSYGGNVNGGTSGGSGPSVTPPVTSSPPTTPTNNTCQVGDLSCGTWMIDYSKCQEGGGSTECPMIWVPY